MRTKGPKTAVLPDFMLRPLVQIAPPARAISFGPPPPVPAPIDEANETALLGAFVPGSVLPFSSDKGISASPIAVTPVNAVTACAMVWRGGGVPRVTVIVKATFALTPDGAARTIEPAPIVTRDRARHGGGLPGELEEAGEIVPYMPTAAVLLSGRAHAPRGRATSAMTVRLALYREAALVDKQVHVFGDRDSHGSPPRPFETMPLMHGRPNLVDPRDPRRAAGFGPLARTSPGRLRLLGTVDPATLDAPRPELARGFDCQFFNAAPADQQTAFLHGDEWIVLDGMHPRLARVQTRLPSAVGKARWNRVTPEGAGPSQSLELVADTLVIDAERMVCSMIWRGHVVLSQDELTPSLQVFAGLELPGQPIDWPQPRSPSWSEIALAETAPFRRLSVTRPASDSSDTPAPDVTGPVDVRQFRSVLPFSGARATAPSVPEMAVETEDVDVRSLRRAITPFNGPRVATPAIPPPPALVFPWSTPSEPEPEPVLLPEPAPVAWSAPIEPAPAKPEAEPEPAPVAVAPSALSPVDEASTTPPTVEAPLNLRDQILARLHERASLQGLTLGGADLRDFDFTGASLAGLDLRRSNLQRAILVGVRAADAQFESADLTEANLERADLSRANLARAIVTKARFDSATLTDVNFQRASGDEPSFRGAKLQGADFRQARLAGANFDEAVLSKATITKTELNGSHFVRADLSSANLRESKLRDADLSDANLEGADLRDTDLHGAKLAGESRRTAKLTPAQVKALGESKK